MSDKTAKPSSQTKPDALSEAVQQSMAAPAPSNPHEAKLAQLEARLDRLVSALHESFGDKLDLPLGPTQLSTLGGEPNPTAASNPSGRRTDPGHHW